MIAKEQLSNLPERIDLFNDDDASLPQPTETKNSDEELPVLEDDAPENIDLKLTHVELDIIVSTLTRCLRITTDPDSINSAQTTKRSTIATKKKEALQSSKLTKKKEENVDEILKEFDNENASILTIPEDFLEGLCMTFATDQTRWTKKSIEKYPIFFLTNVKEGLRKEYHGKMKALYLSSDETTYSKEQRMIEHFILFGTNANDGVVAASSPPPSNAKILEYFVNIVQNAIRSIRNGNGVKIIAEIFPWNRPETVCAKRFAQRPLGEIKVKINAMHEENYRRRSKYSNKNKSGACSILGGLWTEDAALWALLFLSHSRSIMDVVIEFTETRILSPDSGLCVLALNINSLYVLVSALMRFTKKHEKNESTGKPSPKLTSESILAAIPELQLCDIVCNAIQSSNFRFLYVFGRFLNGELDSRITTVDKVIQGFCDDVQRGSFSTSYSEPLSKVLLTVRVNQESRRSTLFDVIRINTNLVFQHLCLSICTNTNGVIPAIPNHIKNSLLDVNDLQELCGERDTSSVKKESLPKPNEDEEECMTVKKEYLTDYMRSNQSVKFLLDRFGLPVDEIDYLGLTPLHLQASMRDCVLPVYTIIKRLQDTFRASCAGDEEEVQRRVADALNVQSIGDGMTALMFVARRMEPSAMDCLLKFGARVDIVDASGRTVLHHLYTNAMSTESLSKLPEDENDVAKCSRSIHDRHMESFIQEQILASQSQTNSEWTSDELSDRMFKHMKTLLNVTDNTGLKCSDYNTKDSDVANYRNHFLTYLKKSVDEVKASPNGCLVLPDDLYELTKDDPEVKEILTGIQCVSDTMSKAEEFNRCAAMAQAVPQKAQEVQQVQAIREVKDAQQFKSFEGETNVNDLD